MTAIQRDVERSQYESLIINANNLKGTALNVGMMRLSNYAEKLIAASRTKSQKNINYALQSIITVMPDTEVEMDNYLKNIGKTRKSN